jgi:hypothetical protein
MMDLWIAVVFDRSRLAGSKSESLPRASWHVVFQVQGSSSKDAVKEAVKGFVREVVEEAVE